MSKARDIASAIPAPSTVSSAELGYLDGVTSAIQTQIDAKIAKTLTTTTGDIIYASSANTPARLGIGSSAQVLSVSGGVPAWSTLSSGPTDWTLLNAGGTALTGATKITVSFTAPKELFVFMVGASAGARSFFTLRPNDDSGADYSVAGIQIQPDNNLTSTVGIGAYSSNTDITFGTMSNNAASVVSAGCFIDTTNQTGNKYYSMTGGGDFGGGQGAQLFATQGLFEAGATITSIAVLSSVGNFDAGTIYVYGAN